MRRLIAVLGALASGLVALGAAAADPLTNPFVCGEIEAINARFLTVIQDGGHGVLLVNGFMRIGAGEPIPLSGSAVPTQKGFAFSMAGGSPEAGILGLTGRFLHGETQGTGACFGFTTCALIGLPVTYKLTEACPTE